MAANGEWRIANGFSKGQCSRTAEKIGTSEGRAPARPKFGTSGDVPSKEVGKLVGVQK